MYNIDILIFWRCDVLIKRNWQINVLLFFLGLWLVFNIEDMFFNVLDFVAMIPLNIHAFAGNILGFETWSDVVTFINSPLVILFGAIITLLIGLKIVRFIDRIFSDK